MSEGRSQLSPVRMVTQLLHLAAAHHSQPTTGVTLHQTSSSSPGVFGKTIPFTQTTHHFLISIIKNWLARSEMCTNHWTSFQCPCEPQLRERAPCQVRQEDRQALCGRSKDSVHVVPHACNPCRQRLKREGIEIGSPRVIFVHMER